METTQEKYKRHLRSAVETFIAVFLIALAAAVDTMPLAEVFTKGTLIALASAATRSTIKATREQFLSK